MKEYSEDSSLIPVNTDSVSKSKTGNQSYPGLPRKELQTRIRKKVGRTGFFMLFFGIVVIVFSLASNSTILAFIGLTLTLWGCLFQFVLPVKHMKSEVTDSIIHSSLSALERIISDLNYRGKAVYLPPYPKEIYVPKHLMDFRDGLVFISKKNSKVESVIEQAFMRNTEGLRLVPPGLGLSRLFEKELGADFFNVNLDFVMDMLPTLLVDDLEIANDFKIRLDGDSVHIEVSGLACKCLYKEANKLISICSNLGCPLISAIACVLAKSTNKPVVIEGCKPRNNVVEAWYRILEG